jgi:hypothetical protein
MAPHVKRHAYILANSIWSTPNVTVCWENSIAELNHEMDIVRDAVADTWEKYSRVRFLGWQKCALKNHGVRIRIMDIGPFTNGLGRHLDKKDGTVTGMTLNFTFKKWSPDCQVRREYCIRAVAIHEFGHALGFAHEQNRPDKPGECRLKPQGPNGDVELTPYDVHSVMNYCNPDWNTNAQLSELDIKAVQQLYGSPIP